jgi:hypothetical protein
MVCAPRKHGATAIEKSAKRENSTKQFINFILFLPPCIRDLLPATENPHSLGCFQRMQLTGVTLGPVAGKPEGANAQVHGMHVDNYANHFRGRTKIADSGI